MPTNLNYLQKHGWFRNLFSHVTISLNIFQWHSKIIKEKPKSSAFQLLFIFFYYFHKQNLHPNKYDAPSFLNPISKFYPVPLLLLPAGTVSLLFEFNQSFIKTLFWLLFLGPGNHFTLLLRSLKNLPNLHQKWFLYPSELLLLSLWSNDMQLLIICNYLFFLKFILVDINIDIAPLFWLTQHCRYMFTHITPPSIVF